MTDITVSPADEARWDDLEEVFGPNGGCEGCWCMYWRVRARDYPRIQGEQARQKLRELVAAEPPPGLLAYRDGQPAGWCTVAPRPNYTRLRYSTTLRPDDPNDSGVWAVPCFYISPEHRRVGVTKNLLQAALSFAADRGGREIEGYAIDSDHRKYSSAELYTGTVDLFARHGFQEVTRPASGRVLMRRQLR